MLCMVRVRPDDPHTGQHTRRPRICFEHCVHIHDAHSVHSGEKRPIRD